MNPHRTDNPAVRANHVAAAEQKKYCDPEDFPKVYLQTYEEVIRYFYWRLDDEQYG